MPDEFKVFGTLVLTGNYTPDVGCGTRYHFSMRTLGLALSVSGAGGRLFKRRAAFRHHQSILNHAGRLRSQRAVPLHRAAVAADPFRGDVRAPEPSRLSLQRECQRAVRRQWQSNRGSGAGSHGGSEGLLGLLPRRARSECDRDDGDRRRLCTRTRTRSRSTNSPSGALRSEMQSQRFHWSSFVIR